MGFYILKYASAHGVNPISFSVSTNGYASGTDGGGKPPVAQEKGAGPRNPLRHGGYFFRELSTYQKSVIMDVSLSSF